MKKKAKIRLWSRIYMYIFLTLSYLTGFGIVSMYAYAELDICVQNPEMFEEFTFMDLVVKNQN